MRGICCLLLVILRWQAAACHFVRRMYWAMANQDERQAIPPGMLLEYVPERHFEAGAGTKAI
jgi:hypothetical protein